MHRRDGPVLGPRVIGDAHGVLCAGNFYAQQNQEFEPQLDLRPDFAEHNSDDPAHATKEVLVVQLPLSKHYAVTRE